ncbi:Intraflagellar transport protein 80 [Entophlyctis sp. JEL0112]|nr:Intraflagellar transport protein 80 [Entophlyctis sp. JEL0112]
MSVGGNDLNTAELSYAAIEQAQKVQYICYIRDIPSQEARAAEMALLRKQVKEAESILVSAGLIYKAIMLSVNLFRWERALELALKNKTHVDTVLYLREKYLRQIRKRETLKLFLTHSAGVTLDAEKIQLRMEAEEAEEKTARARDGGGLKVMQNRERQRSVESQRSR